MIAPCDVKAARYAVEHWHYSRTLPMGKLVKYGIWEHDEFVGCVIFGAGASDSLGSSLGLTGSECCELVRIAMRSHDATVSHYIAETTKKEAARCEGLRAIVSFADPAQGHLGSVYQAANWVYTGTTPLGLQVRIGGRWVHDRSLRSSGAAFVTKGSRLTPEQKKALPRRTTPGKHRYVLPLDKQIRRRVLKLAQPYPQQPCG